MLRKAKVVLVCAMVSMGIFSCSSDDSSSSSEAYEIVAKTSDNAVINNIVVVEDGATESIADLGKKEWSKSFSGKKVVAVSVTGGTIDNDDQSGVLTLEVVKEGKVVKTSKANGNILVATISM
ncbi:hypothetical protein [Myroides sp. WP-1]|uniref:hypothetical protein n=1 Tax=Myroides sp. WP-1 TaxID=2759944 RepID=UPI0015FE5190|nr:hypothetical protein [Myroides sp. WP-1]MBB1138419.1 hypothetical protein [Myroides sp. WP-1]